MKIGLLDIDGHNFPNLPLMKLSAWHKCRGDTVEWCLAIDKYDIIYKSKVFDFTPDLDIALQADLIVEGGTGYNSSVLLPDEIEHTMPDYTLYPQYNSAYGFLTRGCPRNCSFCIVSQKEGCKSVQVANLDEFYNGQKEIKLLDPNLLACADREKILRQLIESKARVDFTQGLDIRLVNIDTVQLLNSIKIKMIHFAWDNPREDLTNQLKLFAEHTTNAKSPQKRAVYVLTNYNSTHEQDLERIYILRNMGYSPYVMIYDKENAPKITRHLQRWVNNRICFWSVEKFEQYSRKLG